MSTQDNELWWDDEAVEAEEFDINQLELYFDKITLSHQRTKPTRVNFKIYWLGGTWEEHVLMWVPGLTLRHYTEVLGVYRSAAVHHTAKTNTYKLGDLDAVVEEPDDLSDKWHIYEVDQVREYAYQIVSGRKPAKKFRTTRYRVGLPGGLPSKIPLYAQFFHHKVVVKQDAIWKVFGEFALPFVVRDLSILLFLIEALKLVPSFERSCFAAYQYDAMARAIYVTPFTT